MLKTTLSKRRDAPAQSNAEEAVGIYKCLCDVNRLRILNLLLAGPQCVCHLDSVLGIGPVRTSQHLSYLKRHGLVRCAVRGAWRVYSLPPKKSREFASNLSCLQDGLFASQVFREDRKRLGVQRCGPKSPFAPQSATC